MSAVIPWSSWSLNKEKSAPRGKPIDGQTNRRRDIATRTACARTLHDLRIEKITEEEAVAEIVELGLTEAAAVSILNRRAKA